MTDHDIYPMPLFPRLTVRDVERSTAFYCDVLGFDELFTLPGGGMSHVRYRKYADVMLTGADSDESPENAGAGVAISLTVEGESVDDIAERVREADHEVDGPTETPWNTREVTVTDPDGYRLVFTQQTETPEQLEWLEDGKPDDVEWTAESDDETDA